MIKSRSGRTAFVLWGATDLGSPHFSGDMLWRAGFKAPDPFVLVEIDDEIFLLVSPLELERAAKESKEPVWVVNYYNYVTKSCGYLTNFLKKHGIEKVVVPDIFPCAQYKALKKSFKVVFAEHSFYPQRAIKTGWEVLEIEKAQRAVEYAVREAIDFLGTCTIDRGLIWAHKPLHLATSEELRYLVDYKLYNLGFLGIGTIVSCGQQAADPHCRGHGPLFAFQPVVIDVFPLSLETHYYADMTRTIFKGEPSKALKDMYEEVMLTQEDAIRWVKAGVDGYDIYEGVCVRFEAALFPTEMKKRPVEGFFHGVGHGVGIDIHEPPSISSHHDILQEGNVVTVEPGLYYQQARDHIPAGGIRIEDMVLVTKDGCRNLTKFPKNLESMIIV